MRLGISRPHTFWLVAALWLGLSAAGLAGMAAYANRPGAPAHAPAAWPTASRLRLDGTRPTLVLLAHPRCDCTRATLAELAELMARAPDASRAYVVFMKPAGVPESWDDTPLWQAARTIPGVTALGDDGRETARFGAETSGQVLLYGRDGRLLFSGGTTVARGHEGDNAGLETVLALLTGGHPSTSRTPVFGCPLFDSPARKEASGE